MCSNTPMNRDGFGADKGERWEISVLPCFFLLVYTLSSSQALPVLGVADLISASRREAKCD